MAQATPDRVQTARRRFFDEGAAPRGLVPETILRSWQRCAGLGLSQSAKPDVAPLTAPAFREMCEKYEDLRRVCLPEVKALYADARATGSIVILTSPDGMILEALGSADFLDKAARVALRPGVPWSERMTGTNAIGTAMIEGRAVEVRGAEHFFAPHRVLSCSAVPIIDPFGKIAGVMDLSGEASVHHVHALGMVRMVVDQIEHRLFEREFPGCRVVRFQRDAGLLGTVHEGIVVFDGERLVAANRHGLALLGLERGDIGRRQFEELFDGRSGDIERNARLRDARGQPLVFHRDVQKAVQSVGVAKKPIQRAPSDAATIEPVFDANLEFELERARRVLAAGMPVLLQGETGTGKEEFARELHRRFARPGAPFIAVNCAGLPENLIESELFGYDEGAFTGARRHGSRGLLRAADGGVLFLDEIGDMPLSLQARLLRTLQEREVTPLGSSKPVKIDIAVVSATHCDLENAVARGEFRGDLFFRISHFAVQLPSLRDHSDRAGLINGIWRRCAAETGITLADGVLPALAAYEWPGNLRQLTGMLRTLVALAGPNGFIGMQDLPPVIRLRQPATPANASTSGPAISPAPASATLAGITEQAIRAAIEASNGNVAAAARKLGVSRSTLYRHMA
ncbi:MAG TPA: sigma-54-dependent Fis family transcriptional regulator [Pseudolabrys sp.]|nr:sigma-54-dependent Fis family transcriptional regulator [Pseudolabrys sp.]